jgi:hypothetical protein
VIGALGAVLADTVGAVAGNGGGGRIAYTTAAAIAIPATAAPIPIPTPARDFCLGASVAGASGSALPSAGRASRIAGAALDSPAF